MPRQLARGAAAGGKGGGKRQAKYKTIRLIGRGSFGSAYLVRRLADSRLCVMKRLSMEHMNEKDHADALNECAVLMKLRRHPNVITVHEHFQEDGRLCIVMDYADGGDLAQRIETQRASGDPFSEDQVLDWFVQICLALKHAHDRCAHACAYVPLETMKTSKPSTIRMSTDTFRSVASTHAHSDVSLYADAHMLAGEDVLVLAHVNAVACSLSNNLANASIPLSINSRVHSAPVQQYWPLPTPAVMLMPTPMRSLWPTALPIPVSRLSKIQGLAHALNHADINDSIRARARIHAHALAHARAKACEHAHDRAEGHACIDSLHMRPARRFSSAALRRPIAPLSAVHGSALSSALLKPAQQAAQSTLATCVQGLADATCRSRKFACTVERTGFAALKGAEARLGRYLGRYFGR
eukprot:4596527-Pleurochrysis_carterae.AAC.2